MSTLTIVMIAAVFCYPVVSAVILKLTERTRDELADVVRGMLVDPTISEEHKVLISSMVDDVFDWRFMAFASVVFPFVAISRRAETEITPVDRAFFKREDSSRLVRLHMRSVMAASPIFTLVFLLTSGAALLIRFLLSFGMVMVSLVWADTIKNVSPSAGPHHLRRVAAG